MEYYLRINDPLAPVYEVDPAANTFRMAGSRIGVIEGVGGEMPDGGATFRTEAFARVWMKRDGEGSVTFTRDQPETTHDR
jgi:hypothetical protein